MKSLIGFVGLRRSGKDTAARALVTEGYEIVKFAGALKEMLRTYLRYVGCPDDYSERLIEGDRKEWAVAAFNGKTCRHAMQTLGTQWGRDLIHPDIWVDACLDRCRQCEKVAVTDVRFANEVEALRAAGGKIVRITRPGVHADGHVSEALTDSLHSDFGIINDGSIEDLQTRVREIAAFIS